MLIAALTTALTADKFGADETPVTNYVPFTAYAKWNIRTFATFDFESFSSDTNLPVRTDSNNNTQTGMKIELNTDSQYSKGNNSLKFYSDTDGADARGNIMLEKAPSDGTRVNIGDTYLITFKYFVDSSYFTLDLGAQYKINDNAKLFINGYNLTNARYAEFGGLYKNGEAKYPMAGRSFIIGAEYTF